MSWSNIFSKRLLITGLTAVVACSAWPSSGSAQPLCGECVPHSDPSRLLHRFELFPGWNNARCDNAGGCHYGWWTGYCFSVHELCFIERMEEIESAIVQANPQEFADALATADSWSFDPSERVLSLTSSCSQHVVARYVLSERLAHVATSIAREKEVQGLLGRSMVGHGSIATGVRLNWTGRNPGRS